MLKITEMNQEDQRRITTEEARGIISILNR